MSRLVDYFVIVGFDHEKERGGRSCGVILQRFPENNWEDTPFHDGIEWFCQPQGWALSTERSEPRFYVSVLTDVDANQHYCACLCFNETVAITPTKPADEYQNLPVDNEREISHRQYDDDGSSSMYDTRPSALVVFLSFVCPGVTKVTRNGRISTRNYNFVSRDISSNAHYASDSRASLAHRLAGLELSASALN